MVELGDLNQAAELLGTTVKQTSPRYTLLLVLLLAATACSDDQHRSSPIEAVQPARVISASEKEAARSLSVVNSGSSADAKDQPLICSQSIRALAKRLLELGALTREQRDALGRAQSIYERRAQATLDSNDSRTEEAAVLLAQQDGDDAAVARTAVACLRALSI